MARYERSIKIAFDKLSGEVREADDLFKNAKEGFAVRKEFNQNKIEPYCCECKQKLIVSTSKYDRIHFRHQPNAGPCTLKDEDLSPAEIEEFTRILKAKETPRHKELKKKIGDRLSAVKGVDVSSISIDDKFIIKGEDRRRPDVYCIYEGKELVFEIQLSQLSLRYILNRYDFYKEHGIYLIWILDNFELHREKPTQLERDIKYLSKYENFFKLDESVEDFKLSCEYKFPFLTEENKLLTKWLTKSAGLDKLLFDEIDYQAYYYNFGDNRDLQEAQQKRNEAAIREVERKKFEKLKQEERIRQEKLLQEQRQEAERLRLRDIHDKVFTIIDWIKRLKKNKAQVFSPVADSINKLAAEELDYFNTNSKLDHLDRNGNPAIHRWIDETQLDTLAFITFILSTPKIAIDINARSSEGLTVCQHLYKSNTPSKGYIMKLALMRGYFLTSDDEEFFNTVEKNHSTEGTLLIYKTCSLLSHKEYIDWIFEHEKLICILESARQNRIIGFAFTNWIAFANNAIEYYGPYFEYIEGAFKHYGLWDRLIQSDKKGTFHKKLSIFYSDFPKQNFEFEKIIRELYPEILSASKAESVS